MDPYRSPDSQNLQQICRLKITFIPLSGFPKYVIKLFFSSSGGVEYLKSHREVVRVDVGLIKCRMPGFRFRSRHVDGGSSLKIEPN